MSETKKFIVSPAPFWHDGGSIAARSRHTLLALLPAVLAGIGQWGGGALAVVALSISTAVFWEWLMTTLMKQPPSIADGNAAVIGMLYGLLLPATAPWWSVLLGTFIAVVIGKSIFGGIGGNAFHPVAVAVAIMMVSWQDLFNFNAALVHYEKAFPMAYPLAELKHFGTAATQVFHWPDLLLGRQSGGIGATFGLGLIAGGVYLNARGFARWEISLSFLAGVFLTAFVFHVADPVRFAGPVFHLLTGYTLIGAFFLATEDSSSPVNFLPMLLYGLGGGVMTVLVRSIGAYIDGVIFAVLLMNVLNPLLDKIRPAAVGKVA